MSLRDKWGKEVEGLLEELDDGYEEEVEIETPIKIPQPIETIIREKIEPKKVDNTENKELIKKYVLAVNYGHKEYEKYNFTNNHEFLLKIFNLIDSL